MVGFEDEHSTHKDLVWVAGFSDAYSTLNARMRMQLPMLHRRFCYDWLM